MSFIEYLKHKRINYVITQLTKNPNLNIKNLFFDAGYRSYPTAWRQFKDVMGMSPAEYASAISTTLVTPPMTLIRGNRARGDGNIR